MGQNGTLMNLRFSRHVELRGKNPIHPAIYRNFLKFVLIWTHGNQLRTGHVIQIV